MNEVTQELNRLYRRCGEPSYRRVSDRTSRLVSHTAVGNLLAGKGLPRWSTVSAVARALRATDAELEALHADLTAMIEERAEKREKLRKLKIRESLVIRPGDTIVLTVDNLNQDPQEYVKDIAAMFPNNTVKLVIGAKAAVIRKEVAA